jgi:hypothetical protein
VPITLVRFNPTSIFLPDFQTTHRHVNKTPAVAPSAFGGLLLTLTKCAAQKTNKKKRTKTTDIFHENSTSGNRLLAFGRTDTHNEVNLRFSQYCERA